MKQLTHLDLFSGIGGFALAFKREGFQTIAFCEIDDYAQRVLQKNFGAVMADTASDRTRTAQERIRRERQASIQGKELRDDTANSGALANASGAQNNTPSKESQGYSEQGWDSLEVGKQTSRPEDRGTNPNNTCGCCPIIYSDIRTLDGTKFRGVTVLTAGVPCQPASQAGKRRGTKDNRWLWPEALRILHESHPCWAIFENPVGILSLEGGLEFERLLAQVEGEGYSVQPIVIPACAVDARHRRDRVWIVANRDGQGPQGRDGGKLSERAGEWIARPSNPSMADSLSTESGRGNNGTKWRQRSKSEIVRNGRQGGATDDVGWLPEPGVGRVAHGIPRRVDRLRGLGNAIVPQVAQVLAKGIKTTLP